MEEARNLIYGLNTTEVMLGADKASKAEQAYIHAAQNLILGKGGVRQAAIQVLGQIKDRAAVQELCTILRNPGLGDERGEGQAAAKALGQIGDSSAIPELATALGIRDWRPGIRKVAAKALGLIGTTDAVLALLNVLRKSDLLSSHDIIEGLRQIGSSAIPILVAVLHDPYCTHHRWEAAEALGQIGDPVAVPGLCAALQDDDVLVRYHSAWALGDIGDACKLQSRIGSFALLVIRLRSCTRPYVQDTLAQ